MKSQERIRVYKPAPFRPDKKITELEARLLAASNGLKQLKRERIR